MGFMIWAKVQWRVSYDAYILNIIFIWRGHSDGMCIARDKRIRWVEAG
jgi:hypothetical protein